MRPLPALALAALVAALAVPAAASPAQEAFARLDADGDGAISREEFLDLRRAMFARIDADGDGFVTETEIAAARETARTNRDTRIWDQDANGDGRLTLAEYTARTRGFDLADRDGDGALSPAEFDRVARFLRQASR